MSHGLYVSNVSLLVEKTKLTQMLKDCCGDLISVEFKLKLKLEPFTLW